MGTLRTKLLLREAIRQLLNEATSDVTFNVFTPWPAEVKRVPYAKSEGVGPGERRAAKMLNGSVMGGSVSFDIDSPAGKFEVKEPLRNIYGEVRTETEGIAALGKNLAHIQNVVKRIASVFGDPARTKIAQAAKATYSPEAYQKISDFVLKPDANGQTSAQWIMRGELGAARMNALADVLTLISVGLKSPVNEEKFVNLVDTDAGIDQRATVTTRTFVKVAQLAGIEPEELRVSHVDLLRSTLSGAAFTHPENFISSVLTAPVKASDVFNQTDGVILVQPDGYIIIPKSDLDSRLIFRRISKGKPYFAMKQ